MHILSLIFVFLFSILASPARADAGLPMIFPVMHDMFWAFIPLVIAEALMLQTTLKSSLKDAVSSSAIVNAVSTFLGLPLAWLSLGVLASYTGGSKAYGLNTCLEKVLAVTWEAPWLMPYGHDIHWMRPLAQLVLLVPFFFASWGVEYWVLRKMYVLPNRAELNLACLKANAVSYACLMLYTIGQIDTSGFASLKPLGHI